MGRLRAETERLKERRWMQKRIERGRMIER